MVDLVTDENIINKSGRIFVNKVKEILDVKFTDDRFYVSAQEDMSLGEYSRCVFFRVADISQHDWFYSSQVKAANAKKISFIMFLTDNYGRPVDELKIEASISYQYTDNGLVYEKITSDCPLKATEELVEWFRINKDLIINTR